MLYTIRKHLELMLKPRKFCVHSHFAHDSWAWLVMTSHPLVYHTRLAHLVLIWTVDQHTARHNLRLAVCRFNMAKPSDWHTKPLPEKHVVIEFGRQFSKVCGHKLKINQNIKVSMRKRRERQALYSISSDHLHP